MNNIHPIFSDLLKPYMPMQAFKVTINGETTTVLAPNSIDAIRMVSDMTPDADIPADGLVISVKPVKS